MDLAEQRIRHRLEEREIALKEKVNQLKDRIERIKRMSDVKAMVQQRPALMMAGSVVAGYLVRKLTSRRPVARRSYRQKDFGRTVEYDGSQQASSTRSSGKLKEHLAAILTGVATRTAMNLLTELGKQVIPRRSDVRRAERNFRRIR